MKKQTLQLMIRKLSIFFVSIGVVVFFLQCEKARSGNPIDPSGQNTPEVLALEKEDPLAFPGAEGGGKFSTGGRGGKVIKVTSLEDSGPGSLRNAIDQKGARIVVFEVSGNIVLKSRLRIKNGDLTIAGQTAPGDGVCIQNYDVNVDADNVIIRFMRFRMGDLTGNEQDALWGRHHQNIIIDHCTMSWSIDESASFYANKDFTMQWCIISESLNESVHVKGDHGFGDIWGGVNATFHHNLLAHHESRNPRFDGGNRSGTGRSPYGNDVVDFRNNVIYNWGDNSSYGGENGSYNMVSNYYKPGPGTALSKRHRILEIYMEPDVSAYGPGFGKFFIDQNYVYGDASVTQDNWNGGVDKGKGLSDADYVSAKSVKPFETAAIKSQPSDIAFDAVLLYSGASLKRDAVDTRIVGEVRDGTTTYSGSKTGREGIIDSQADVGGWPTLKSLPPPEDTDGDGIPDGWEIAHKLDPNKANDKNHSLSTIYTDIEVYMNSLAKFITDNQSDF